MEELEQRTNTWILHWTSGHEYVLLITGPFTSKSTTVASKAGPSGWFEGLPRLQGALCIVYKLRAVS